MYLTGLLYQAGENVIEDLTVINEDDNVLSGFSAITKAHDYGMCSKFAYSIHQSTVTEIITPKLNYLK